VPNFAPIDQTVAEIWPFIDIPRWRLSAILDLLYACLGPLHGSQRTKNHARV